MAASSSSISGYCEPSASSSVPEHDIFLSHSGAQKPFAIALYERLRTRYTTFLDKTDHSLPLGENFPPHIFHATDTCRLAVIVLSEEYLQSKWPMRELCAFFKATPQPKIVPLFFKVAPSDLKLEVNKEKWRMIWDGFAKEDSRIKVPDWEFAVRQLAKHNGISKEQCEEEPAYIERVFARICENLPPSIRHDFSDFPGIHRMSQAVLAKFEELDTDESKVCVLGMYGLPGSGKSTLCMYLRDHYSTKFAGKVVHSEWPMVAGAEEVLIKYKELLNKLTNFSKKMDLSNVSHLLEARRLLRGTDFSASKVFLIVDNVSCQESRDLVKDLLGLGFAVGSKVLIVAHTVSRLNPLLQKDGPHSSSHYVYGCMCVPYLHKNEALQILLRSGGGMGLADEGSLTPEDQQIIAKIEEVVDMCTAKNQHLPLILKAMGNLLTEHERSDVHKWNQEITEILVRFKEEAVNKLMEKSFGALSKNLQTLFLDLALFIVPLCRSNRESVWMGADLFGLLSLMHGLKQEELELEMNDLQRRGFLTTSKIGDRHANSFVHDLYLEFAAGSEKACNYFWSDLIRSKLQLNEAMGGARTRELRTVFLELDEGHIYYEFGKEHATVKAMILRNCQSLEILCGLKNCTSLMSLQIWNCPNLKKVQRPAGRNLQVFTWSDQGFFEESSDGKVLSNPLFEATSMSKKQTGELISRMKLGRRSLMGIDELLVQMENIEVLRLVNTGIRNPVNLSGRLPRLKVLQVLEPHLKGLRACDLPSLELLMYFGYRYMGFEYEELDNFVMAKLSDIGWKNMFAELPEHNLVVNPSTDIPDSHNRGKCVNFAGCPKLQVVHMHCASLGNELQVIPKASHMKELVLNGIWNGSNLSHFIAAAEALERLYFTSVRGFTDLKFISTYKNLRELWLRNCPSVVQVTGLDGLPVLASLTIRDCESLKTLSGVGGLAGLRSFKMQSCWKLKFQSFKHDLESLTELEHIDIVCGGSMNEAFNVRELVNLRELSLYIDTSITDTTCWLIGSESVTRLNKLHLTGNLGPGSDVRVDSALLIVGGPSQLSFLPIRDLSLGNLSNLRSLKGLEYLGSLEELSLRNLPNLTSWKGVECLGSLKYLSLTSIPNLTSFNDVKCPSSLKELWLEGLKNLTSLQGIQSLINLQSLIISCCPSVEEMPSLSTLVQLSFLDCGESGGDCGNLPNLEGWKVKSLELEARRKRRCLAI